MAVGAVLPWLIWQWTERKEHFLEPLQLAANYDPPAFMLIKLLGNFSSVFFDIPFSLKSYGVVIFALVVGLAIFAYGYTALKAENKSGLLMLCTGLAPIVVLITSDLIWGSYRFGTVRYWTPLVIGLWLAMGYFFARQIGSESKVKSRLWSLALAVLVGIEIFSSLASMNTLEWWTKRQRDINLPLIASALNTSPNALLVVSDAHQENLGTALALSRLLKPDVRVEFVRANRIPDLPGVYQNIFFLDNSTTYVKNVGRAMHFDLLGSDKTAAFYKAVVVVRR